MDYANIITNDPGKRSGKPCLRGRRIAVEDVLGYFSAGMTRQQILDFSTISQT